MAPAADCPCTSRSSNSMCDSRCTTSRAAVVPAALVVDGVAPRREPLDDPPVAAAALAGAGLAAPEPAFDGAAAAAGGGADGAVAAAFLSLCERLAIAVPPSTQDSTAMTSAPFTAFPRAARTRTGRA